MDLKTTGIRTVTTSLTATLAFALLSSPAKAQDYAVQPGDTVSEIAAGHGVSAATIISTNKLDERATIYAGRHLVLPDGATGPSPAPALGTYVVAKGDTLWAIAKRFGTSVTALQSANGLDGSTIIRIGETLVIPGGASLTKAAATPASTSQYIVVRGDTLSAIAKRFGTTVAALASANNLANPSIIRTGLALTVPGAPTSGLVSATFLGRTYPAEVVAAANVNKATLDAMDVPSRVQMQQLVIDTANEMGIDPALAQAVAYQESGFNMRAVSSANAIGCMQVIPSSGDWASDLVGRDLNLLDPEDNVIAGLAILGQLQRNNTPVETAIAGYYQGERSVRERGLNADTTRYVASVLALQERFK